jgi:hypothetical protein
VRARQFSPHTDMTSEIARDDMPRESALDDDHVSV